LQACFCMLPTSEVRQEHGIWVDVHCVCIKRSSSKTGSILFLQNQDRSTQKPSTPEKNLSTLRQRLRSRPVADLVAMLGPRLSCNGLPNWMCLALVLINGLCAWTSL
jgi:hypothetical protein